MKEVVLKDGRKMLVLEDDEGISLELQTNGGHEEACSDFLKELLCVDDIVFDIGANIGYFVFLEADIVEHVYAFEPVPRNIECLIANINEYKYENVTPFEVALGNENKIMPMRLAVFSNSGTLIDDKITSNWYKSWFSGWQTKTIKVEQVTLDFFVDLNELPTPDIIRMDVEGYEVEVIAGAQRTLSEMRKGGSLFIELHPPVFAKKLEVMNGLIDNLLSYGFKPVWSDGITEFDDDFAAWACDDRHCPHTFFVKE